MFPLVPAHTYNVISITRANHVAWLTRFGQPAARKKTRGNRTTHPLCVAVCLREANRGRNPVSRMCAGLTRLSRVRLRDLLIAWPLLSTFNRPFDCFSASLFIPPLLFCRCPCSPPFLFAIVVFLLGTSQYCSEKEHQITELSFYGERKILKNY